MFREINYNTALVIGTPLVGWKCDRNEDMSWLKSAEEIKEKFPNAQFFAALELDHRGLEPFERVIKSLDAVNGAWWTYTINDNEPKVTSTNRWVRIETGRNLVREFAQRGRLMSGNFWGEETTQEGVVNYSGILYVDSDIKLTVRHIEALLEVDHPLVGIDVGAYCLSGPVVNESPRIEEHWNTAGMLYVNAPAFYDLIWHHNAYINCSDDPSFQYMSERLLRFDRYPDSKETWGQTWVRKDIQALHEVDALVGVEERGIPDRSYE